MTRLERNVQLFWILRDLLSAYEDGDFTEFVSLLAEDCVYTSMWVLESLCGRDAVANHLLKKGASIRESASYPSGRIVELVGNMNPVSDTELVVNGEKKNGSVALMYEPGKYCLMLEQELDGKTNQTLVDLKLDSEGKVQRIDLCMPELFRTRAMYDWINLRFAKKDEEHEADEVMVGKTYLTELYLFFGLAGIYFDEYADQYIPMEKWDKMLEHWKQFIAATDYDATYEQLAGVDYDDWTVGDKAANRRLKQNGAYLWKERKNRAVMLADLIEWTERYRSEYDGIQFEW